MLTLLDGYCGAGGSSSGAEQVPGVQVRYALNHWRMAIDTHNHNMPHVDHDRVDMTHEEEGNPRKYAATDLGWFSPECTTWSQARGEECDYDDKPVQGDLLNQVDEVGPEPDEAKQRSRFQMETVPIFAAAHDYKAVIVENVTDILKWRELDRWLAEMRTLGYEHRIVVLNSAFAHQLGAPAPQLRDRVYFVFWKSRYRTPDFNKWCRPMAWCPTCEQVVRAMFVDKRPTVRRAMRYAQQYTFRCPSSTCRASIVHPYVLAAAAAIDWALPAERIGDRKDPLKPKTLARIEAGLQRYARPITLETAGNTFERRPGVRTWPAEAPLTTQTTTPTKAVACPPFIALLRSNATTHRVGDPLTTLSAGGGHHGLVDPLLVPAGGTWNDAATSVLTPMRARTTRETEALVVPVEGRDGIRARSAGEPYRAQTARHQDALVVPLRNNGVARPARSHPAPAFAAAGTHHALVMRNNNGGAEMSTPVDEPVRTLTTKGHQSVVAWGHGHVVYGYDTGRLRPLGLPLPTQTTVQGDALLGRAVAVEDCTFRMLDVHEIKAGMAFADRFELPFGAKRDKIRLLGNAVTPPAARDLIAAVVEAITGELLEVA